MPLNAIGENFIVAPVEVCDWILRAIISTGITGELAVDDEVVTPLVPRATCWYRLMLVPSNAAFLCEVDLILGLQHAHIADACAAALVDETTELSGKKPGS